MPFLTDKDIEDRVSSPKNLVNTVTFHKTREGNKGHGNINIPIEIKKSIAIITQDENANKKEIAEAFGISYDSTRDISDGVIAGDSNTPRTALPELKKVIAEKRAGLTLDRLNVESKAIAALLGSLNLLPSKLNKAKAKDLSSIAKDMASVANMMTDKSNDGDGSKSVHLHLYAPTQKKISDYDVIDV